MATLRDIDITTVKLLNEDYRLFKKAITLSDEDGAFPVPKEIEGILITQDLIAHQRIWNTETKTHDETGKFILTIEAKFYIEYKDELHKKALIQGAYNWLTLTIAILALFFSLVGVWFDYIAPTIHNINTPSASESGIITNGEG